MPDYGATPTPAERVRAEIAAMERDGDTYVVTESAVRAVKDFAASVDSNNDRLAVLGRIDVDRMIALSRDGGVEWWYAFHGRVFAGDLEGMRKVYNAMQEKTDKSGDLPSYTSSMTWITKPLTLSGGFTSNIKAEVFKQLLDWGADASFNGGTHFNDALMNLDTDCLEVLVDGGANPDTVFTVLSDLRANNMSKQEEKLRAAVKGKKLYHKLDEQILMEAKLLPDANGVSSLKTLFNFRAARVTDIYEYGPGKRTVSTTSTFDEYDPEALGFAREKLQALGGKPRDALSKPKRKGLSS